MGMAASQARLLGLAARKSNLEYQGQQINQERTILSQQCTELYNSLLAIQVPTPPSTNDFTAIQYTGSDGATKYQFDASSVKPGSNGTYRLTLATKEYGDSLSKNNGYATTNKGPEVHKGTMLTDNTITKDQFDDLWIESNGSWRRATSGDATLSDDGQTYTLNPDTSYFLEEAAGEDSINIGTNNDYTIAGYLATTLDAALNNGQITQDQYDGYLEAIEHAGITLADKDAPCNKDDFYIYIDDNKNVHFALKSEVQTASEGKSGAAVTYDYIANGEFIDSKEYDYCNLEFDPSSGRIISMQIPASKDGEGKPLSYTTIKVSSSTITDNAAYEDAFAQYEYEQYLYDKKQQEINAKTEIIQQQDRNLELKLTRLDNERKMIEAEYDAVKNVVEKNIDSSFKTFSG